MRDVRVGRRIQPVRRDNTYHRPAPYVHRRYHYRRADWERRWLRRYHHHYRPRGLSISWHFWYGTPVRRYRPYWYTPRRYYRYGRPAVGFYIRVPSYHIRYLNRDRYFVYKQTVNTRSDYGAGQYNAELEVHTRLKQTIKHVYSDRIKMEFRVEGISLYRGGYFLGEVHGTPRSHGTMKVTLYNDGYVEFDRMVYLVGDEEIGFELISTRYYGGHLLNEYRRGDGLRAAELDFYERRVHTVNRSRVFDPYDFNGLVPIALMPDDEYWGFQYLTGGHRFSNDYYTGAYDYYDGYDARDDDRFYSGSSYYYGDVLDDRGRAGAPLFSTVDDRLERMERTTTDSDQAFSNGGRYEYTLENGSKVAVERVVEIKQIDS